MRDFSRVGRKIVAIGRNFADHAKELGNPLPKTPIIFLKPTSSYLADGGTVELPRGSDVHYETELGVVLGKRGTDIPEKQAMSYVAGYCLALDMTARDMQAEAKKAGLPWSLCKGFDTFTPVSAFVPRENVPDPRNVDLWLKVNGDFKQKGNTSSMIFSIPALISFVSQCMRLDEGDVILTGTPAGAGPVKPGDELVGGMGIPGKGDVVTFKFRAEVRPGRGLWGAEGGAKL